MTDFRIESVGVIGLGLIGASVLKDIQSHKPEINRLGYSLGRELDIAKNQDLIQDSSFQEMVDICDLIVIATPIDSVIDVAEKIAQYKKTSKRLLVIDVASVKKKISQIFTNLSTPTITFIPTHPMGGSEKNGYEGARRGLFRQKPWIFCIERNEQNNALIALENFIKDCCGSKVKYLTPEQHDKYVTTVSHFVLDLSSLLFDFVNTKHPESLGVAGESFITTTRLASDNPKMLADINNQNFDSIKKIFEEFSDYLKTKFDNPNKLDQDFFVDNKLTRDRWMHYRNRFHE